MPCLPAVNPVSQAADSRGDASGGFTSALPLGGEGCGIDKGGGG